MPELVDDDDFTSSSNGPLPGTYTDDDDEEDSWSPDVTTTSVYNDASMCFSTLPPASSSSSSSSESSSDKKKRFIEKFNAHKKLKRSSSSSSSSGGFSQFQKGGACEFAAAGCSQCARCAVDDTLECHCLRNAAAAAPTLTAAGGCIAIAEDVTYPTDLTFDAGDDCFAVAGRYTGAAAALLDGDDTVIVASGGVVVNGIDVGDGDNNVVAYPFSTIDTNVNAGTGIDKVYVGLQAFVESVDLGAGTTDNVLINHGHIAGDVVSTSTGSFELYQGTCGRIFGAVSTGDAIDTNLALATGSVIGSTLTIGTTTGNMHAHFGGAIVGDVTVTEVVDVRLTMYSQARMGGAVTFTANSGDMYWLMHSHSSIVGDTTITAASGTGNGVFLFHDYVDLAAFDVTSSVFDEKLLVSAGTGFNAAAFSITANTGAARARVQFGPFAQVESFLLDADAFDFTAGTEFRALAATGVDLTAVPGANVRPSTAYFEPNAVLANLDMDGEVVLFANGLSTPTADVTTGTQVREIWLACNANIDTLNTDTDPTVTDTLYIEAGSYAGVSTWTGTATDVAVSGEEKFAFRISCPETELGAPCTRSGSGV